MFSYTYHVRPVDPTNDVYRLSLTKESWMKLLLQSVLPWAVIGGAGVVVQKREQRKLNESVETTD